MVPQRRLKEYAERILLECLFGKTLAYIGKWRYAHYQLEEALRLLDVPHS
jgi:hypothetical protein